MRYKSVKQYGNLIDGTDFEDSMETTGAYPKHNGDTSKSKFLKMFCLPLLSGFKSHDNFHL